MKPLPAGFHDPLEMDTPTLERAVSAARADRFDCTQSMQCDLESWLSVAEPELNRRADQHSPRVTLETRDGAAFSTMLEFRDRGWMVNLSGDGLEAQVPLTALIASLLARKLGKRVLA